MSTDPRAYTYADDILKDRIILITGASDGIGKALALHAATLGARVILHGRSVPKLEKVYDAIEADCYLRPSTLRCTGRTARAARRRVACRLSSWNSCWRRQVASLGHGG